VIPGWAGTSFSGWVGIALLQLGRSPTPLAGPESLPSRLGQSNFSWSGRLALEWAAGRRSPCNSAGPAIPSPRLGRRAAYSSWAAPPLPPPAQASAIVPRPGLPPAPISWPGHFLAGIGLAAPGRHLHGRASVVSRPTLAWPASSSQRPADISSFPDICIVLHRMLVLGRP
jgi:hypothetical protein